MARLTKRRRGSTPRPGAVRRLERAELRSAAVRADSVREKTPAFFTFEAPLIALGIILVLWVLITATIAAFRRVDRRAAGLLLPYLVWVTFAAVLNVELWRLNA